MGKYTQQEETNTKMPGYRGRNYQSSGNDALVARKEEERIRRYRENEARQEAEWARAISSERERDEERRREQQRKDDSARALGFADDRQKQREDDSARKQGFNDAQHRRRENDSARALGFDDAQHKKRVTAAVDTVCGQVERMKKDELPHVTLTVQSADDSDLFTEVTVSDEARVADVLAVACRAQHKPLPRSTLSFGGDNLDAFMAEKLTDLDIETDAVLRLVQLCDGQVNDLALGALTEKAGPAHCTCFSWLFSR